MSASRTSAAPRAAEAGRRAAWRRPTMAPCGVRADEADEDERPGEGGRGAGEHDDRGDRAARVRQRAGSRGRERRRRRGRERPAGGRRGERGPHPTARSGSEREGGVEVAAGERADRPEPVAVERLGVAEQHERRERGEPGGHGGTGDDEERGGGGRTRGRRDACDEGALHRARRASAKAASPSTDVTPASEMPSTTANEAPALTPSRPGSAIGLRVTPCMTTPRCRARRRRAGR